MKIVVLDEISIQDFSGLYDRSWLTYFDDSTILMGAVDDTKEPYVPIATIIASTYLTELSLQWIYVKPEYRRQQVAYKMLDQLFQTCYEAGIQNINMTLSENNEGGMALLKKMGFEMFHALGWHQYKAKIGDFSAIPETNTSEYQVRSFMSANKEMLQKLNQHLQDTDALVGVPLLVDPRAYSPFSSCCIVNNHIASLLLVDSYVEDGKRIVEIPWVYMDSDALHALPLMYNATFKSLKQYYGENTEVHFSTISQSMDEIVTKIVPTAEFSEIYIATLSFDDSNFEKFFEE